MILVILATGLTIISATPPLPPAQAAAVLRSSRSPQDLTDYRAWTIEVHPYVVERRVAPQPAARSESPAAPRPLQNPPTIGQCWVGTPCIVGPPTVIIRKEN